MTNLLPRLKGHHEADAPLVINASIFSVPSPKSFEKAFDMTNRYATAMYNCREQLVRTYPQYEEPLYEHYLVIYNRDYTRITKLFKDFPFTKSE